MSDQNSTCPNCQSPYGYFDGTLWVCPECAHEWSLDFDAGEDSIKAINIFADANGTELKDGDTVVVIKDLKVGGSTLKPGTKVKNIKLLNEAVDGHDISCRIQGIGSIYLKCSVVKKGS